MLSQLDQFNFHHRISEDPAPTLTLFTSSACSSCRHLKRILEQLSLRQPAWILYEVDAQRDMALTHEFEIFHLPALFLFHGGLFHSEIQCDASVAAVEATVIEALQKGPLEAP